MFIVIIVISGTTATAAAGEYLSAAQRIIQQLRNRSLPNQPQSSPTTRRRAQEETVKIQRQFGPESREKAG